MKRAKNFFANTFESIFTSTTKDSKGYFSNLEDFQFQAHSLKQASPFSEVISLTFSHLENRTSELKAEGFRLGLRSVEPDANYPTELLEVFNAQCDKDANIVFAIFETQENELEGRYNLISKDLEMTLNERVHDADELNRHLLNDAEVEYEEQKVDTSESKELSITLMEEINEHDIIIEQNEQKIGNVRLKKNILDTPLLLISSILFLAWIDSNMIIEAFNALKVTTNIGYGIGFMLSVMTVGSGFYMAKNAGANHVKNWWHGLYLGLSVIVIVLLIRMGGSSQIAERNDTDINFLKDILFTGLNAMFWFLTYLFEKYRLQRLPNFIAQKEIKSNKRKRNQKIMKKAKLDAHVNKTNTLNEKRKSAFLQNYQGQIVERAKSADKILHNKRSELLSQLKTIRYLRNYFKNDIEAIRIFGKKTYLESFRKGINKRRSSMKIYGRIGVIIFVCLISSLTGCRSMEEHFYGKLDVHNTRVIHDQTIEPINQNQININRLHHFLITDLWKLDDGIPRTKVDFNFSTIDDLFIQEDRYLGLEEGAPKFNRVEWNREDTLSIFKEKTLQLLQKNIKNGNGKNHSKINLCLCRNINELSSSDSNSIKTLIVISDFLEHSKNSFYPFQNQPQKLIGSEYERLAKAFSEECPLKDLTGIKVIGVFKPTSSEMDDFIFNATEFWKKYLERHGAEFSFRANF